jgi:hypothetical protein
LYFNVRTENCNILRIIPRYVMRALTLIPVIILCFTIARAQQPPKISQPTEPARPIQPLATPSNVSSQTAVDTPRPEPATSAQIEPDTHVLSGVETVGLGSLHGFRRIFDPALQFSEVDNTGLVPGKNILASNLGGSLDMNQQWGPYQLAAEYRGAEVMYQPSYFGMHFLPYHDFSISPELLYGRWTLRLRDNVSYSWQSGFGGLFTGGLAQVTQNNVLNSVQPSLLSNATIQTGLARQLSNTTLAEADYAFSRRTMLTFVGSYGLMQFLDPGYIDSRSIDGRLGYNYALSAANSISLSYDYNHTSFGGSPNRLQTDLVQMSFGRKITGRLAFQLAAGPQLLRLDNYGTSRTHQLSWSASSTLIYNLDRTRYLLSYFHGVTAGSGVFFGSKGDTLTATVNHDFTRFWSISVNGGYATNNILSPVTIFADRFDNWFAGASLSRQVGRQVNVKLNYGFERQGSRGGACPVLSCGLPGATSFRQVGVTLQWHPLALQNR